MNFKRVFIAIAMILTVSVSASAHDFEVDGIYYNITSSTDKTCAVTYKGTSNSSYSNEYTGEIVIPESVTYEGITYSVTSIGNYAFSGCSGLTSVTIPNSVTSIGFSAFVGCRGLTSVTIPNSVTSIGYDAFYNCSGLKSVNIPDGVTSIGSYAFKNCSSLTSVTIPNSVTSIGSYAFSGCSGLTSVTIPNSVTSINGNVFSSCSNLESIIVESGNTKYDSRNNCNAIIETSTNTLIAGCKNTTIPNSVTNIGSYAFSGCSGLTSVTIPNSVTSIGEDAFYYTGWYNNQSDGILYLDNCCLGYKGDKPTGELSLKDNTRLIANSAFSYCSGLTSVTIPDGVTSIGNYAFSSCSGLTSVTIRNSVTSIGISAFSYCSGLTSVTIPNSVTSIGSSAFSYCSGLTSVTIPNSVTSINGNVFSSCSNLESIIVESGNTKYDSRNNCNAIIETSTNTLIAGCKNTTIPNSVTNIGDDAFSGCSGLTSVTIPNSVTSIGDYAFYNCSGLTSVTIPDGVTSIGNYAFSRCSGLTSVTIPNSVTSIGDWAFSGCRGLTSVTIPNGVTSIANYAFSSCYGLTSVTIPNSVTSIANYAFSSCNNLTNIECKAKNPPTLGENVFSNYSVSLIIPLGSYSKYKEAEEWNKFIISDKYVMDNIYYTLLNESELTVVSKDTNYNSYSGEIVIPLEIAVDEVKYIVTQIGEKAFYNCSDLTSVTIPNSVTSIGSYAFSGCSGLTKVEITDINSWCKIHFGNETANPLYYAGKLYMDSTLVTDISIENIEEIKPYAFYNLTTLMSLSLDENVSKIGDKAFYGNKNIRSITCKATTPPTCGTDVFNSVKTEAATLTVPKESVSLYQVAYTWMDFWNIIGSEFSGIENTLIDDTEEAEYYNLQGVKVVNPLSGLYIKKQGNKVTKVIL